MSQRARLRQLRKQSLQLRAQRHRLALRSDWRELREPFTQQGGSAATWLPLAAGLLGVLSSGVKGGRWARLMSIGSLSWQLVKRVLATPADTPPDKA